MRSEHKGKEHDIRSNIFDLLRKYSSFCVISLKWDNRYKNLYSDVSSFISMQGHLYYISLFNNHLFLKGCKPFWASHTLPRSLTTHHHFLHESIAMQGCATVTWRMLLWSSLVAKSKCAAMCEICRLWVSINHVRRTFIFFASTAWYLEGGAYRLDISVQGQTT